MLALAEVSSFAGSMKLRCIDIIACTGLTAAEVPVREQLFKYG
jgi:hypothetical protein